MSNVTDETLKHFLKNERRQKLYEPARTMFSVIYMIYFQALQGEEKNKPLLLRLHEAKAKELTELTILTQLKIGFLISTWSN